MARAGRSGDPFDGWTRAHDGELRKVALATGGGIGCWIVGQLVLWLAFWAAVIYVVVHFVCKWW